MAPRFTWGTEQIEEFFKVLRGSYQDYLVAKELRRMDEFYEMIGTCIGADGLVVQNFLKKTGRAYRDILLQADTCGEGAEAPERKLRGSKRVYRLYEEYYQMYYLGSVPVTNSTDASTSTPSKQLTTADLRKRRTCGDTQASPRVSKKRSMQATEELDIRDEKAFLLDVEAITDHVQETTRHIHVQGGDNAAAGVSIEATECTAHNGDTREHGKKQVYPPETVADDARSSTRQHTEGSAPDGVFGQTTDFQERFLKLMENQNHILSNIADELNLIRHAVLDANGLQTITYVK